MFEPVVFESSQSAAVLGHIKKAQHIVTEHVKHKNGLCAVKSTGDRTGADDTLFDTLMAAAKGQPRIQDSLVDSARFSFARQNVFVFV